MGKKSEVLLDRSQVSLQDLGVCREIPRPPKPTTLNENNVGRLVFGRETVNAWEAVEPHKNRELRLSSMRSRIDRRRKRSQFEIPAGEDFLHTLLAERKGWPGVAEDESSEWGWGLHSHVVGPPGSTLGQRCCKQPHCNNSGTAGLKGDSLAGIGLQPEELSRDFPHRRRLTPV